MNIRLFRYLIILALIVVTFFIYWQVYSFEFLTWDDGINIYENQFFNPVALSNIVYFWKEPFLNLYIPVTYTLWGILSLLSVSLYGALKPNLFHLANLFLHTVNVLILFFVLKILLSGSDCYRGLKSVNGRSFECNLAACCGAMLFAAHPVQVEVVSWITGMKDILSSFFSLMAIWRYVIYIKSDSFSETKKRSQNYWLALASYVLALLAKPAVVVLPFILWLLDYGIFNRPAKKSFHSLAGWLLPAIPLVVLTKLAQPDRGLDFVTPLLVRPFIALDALAFYIVKLILPLNLGPDYGRFPELVLSGSQVYFSWLIPVVLVVLLMMAKGRRFFGVSFGVFTAGIMPVMGLIPFGFQNFSTVADRYLYFPMTGAAMALSFFLGKNRNTTVFILCFLLLSLYIGISKSQVRHWRNSYTLFKHAVKVNPDSPVAHNNYGSALFEKKEYDKAVSNYYKAVKSKPDYVDAYFNLGVVFARLGKTDLSIRNYKTALKLDPGYAEGYNNLGAVLADEGKMEEAFASYRKALELYPRFVKAHYNLAVALAKTGNKEKAVQLYYRIISINPEYVDAYNNLGVILAGQGRVDEAINLYVNAIKIEPYYFKAHNNLANIYARKGRYDEALKHYSEVLRIDPGNHVALRNADQVRRMLR